MAKAEGHATEGLAVDLGGGSGKMGKESDGMANVEATDNAGVDEFTKETTAAKPMLVLEVSMFGGVLAGADGVEAGCDGQ